MICIMHCKEKNARKVFMFRNNSHRATSNKVITKPFSHPFLCTICRCSERCYNIQRLMGLSRLQTPSSIRSCTCAHYCSLKPSLQSALGSGLPGKRKASLPCWTFAYRLSRIAALKMHLITQKIFCGTILISTATWISIIEEWAYMLKWTGSEQIHLYHIP